MARNRSEVGALVDRFSEAVRRRGLRLTRQRLAIARRFFEHGGHLTVDDLYQRTLATDPEIGYATVYRTLRLMVDCGIAEAHTFGANKVRFELPEADNHHDHLICTECGRIIEFEEEAIERLQEEVARRHEFTMTSHSMEIYGRCRSCEEGTS